MALNGAMFKEFQVFIAMKNESGTKIALKIFKFSSEAVDKGSNSITRQGKRYFS